jgi:uncharacterized membrane protein YjjP (DUF1212 family)
MPAPAPPTAGPTDRRPAGEADRDGVRFILAVARALHTAGTTAQSLEYSLERLANRLGLVEPQFFSTPTSIMFAFGPAGSQEVHVQRLAPAGPNIGRLSRLDRVVTGVLDASLSPDAALVQVEAIEREPSPYAPLLTILAFGLGSAGIARFLGGGLVEVAVGGLLGVVTGTLETAAERVRGLARVYEPLAALVAAFVASALAHWVGSYSSFIATLAGIVVLLPGLLLTNAVRELAERHLASGTARLAGAGMTLLALIFGVALGNHLAAGLFGAMPQAAPVALPRWTIVPSVVAAGLSFVVILKAERRDAAVIVGACAASYLLGAGSARLAGAELGLFVAALLDSVGAAVWSRWRNRPQSVVLVPATLMLVPGSIGFRSLNSMLDRNVIDAVQTAFTMILAATALSAGLLAGGLVVPGRRSADRRREPRGARANESGRPRPPFPER